MSYDAVDIVPRWRINELAEYARGLVPASCSGSFIVDFPYPLVLNQWMPLEGHVYTPRVVGLLPSQQIARHADAPSTPPFTRYHICLRTNEGCWSFSMNDWQRLQEGVIYRMDPTQPHGAVNWGSEIRLHLMIDVEGA